jgi:hypothetical protein
MPIDNTFVRGLPVAPIHCPDLTRAEKSAIFQE